MTNVSFIASHLAPRLGVENALVVLQRLFEISGVSSEVVCMGGDARDLKVLPNAVICGPPIKGVKRLNVWRASKARRVSAGTDLVILVGAWAAIPYLLVNRRDKRRIIVWEHSLSAEKIQTNAMLKVLSGLARRLYRRADLVIGVSEPLAQDLRSLGVANARVIPNVIEEPLGRSTSERANNPARLIMLGSLTDTKNQELAIKALAKLASPAVMSIVGSGPNELALRRLVDELGIGAHVSFEGFLEHDAAMGLLERADLLVHCAHGETFGYVYFEAANRHVPVVAVTNSVSRGIVPAFVPGLLVGDSAVELANAIGEILATPPASEVFAAADEARSRIFSSDAVLESWRIAFDGKV
ncbi:glycosyltransferase family 4 protein [Microbacterium sp. A196]|uniref:glycosyltransferase family 4 protein n=1 Tax=Microbacterium sp. A196 TaxID=3457320 RepID=UPI003FD5E6F6